MSQQALEKPIEQRHGTPSWSSLSAIWGSCKSLDYNCLALKGGIFWFQRGKETPIGIAQPCKRRTNPDLRRKVPLTYSKKLSRPLGTSLLLFLDRYLVEQAVRAAGFHVQTFIGIEAFKRIMASINQQLQYYEESWADLRCLPSIRSLSRLEGALWDCFLLKQLRNLPWLLGSKTPHKAGQLWLKPTLLCLP